MELPLFPLPVVLFPGALMPLHVFEPRYQALLAHVVEHEHRFVLLEPGEDGAPAPGTIGSVARVRAVQPLPEGRSNIVVSGEERVVLDRLVPSETPYLVGAVSALADDDDTQVASPAEVGRLRELGARYGAGLAALNDVEPHTEFADDSATLSFQVAALLEWTLDSKRLFLAIRSPRERVVRLLATVPRLLADLEGRVTVHRRASSNGTGHRP